MYDWDQTIHIRLSIKMGNPKLDNSGSIRWQNYIYNEIYKVMGFMLNALIDAKLVIY